jgi:hypothetical protein
MLSEHPFKLRTVIGLLTRYLGDCLNRDALAQQIQGGAPFDVFLAANRAKEFGFTPAD